MSTRVFVGQLDWGTTNEDLDQLFSSNGKVLKASIITRGRKSLGYGFVDFENNEDAEKAIATLNKTLYKDRTLKVESARPQVTNDAQGDGQGQQQSYNANNYRNFPPQQIGRTRPNFRRNNYNNNYNSYNNYPPRYNTYYNRRPQNPDYQQNQSQGQPQLNQSQRQQQQNQSQGQQQQLNQSQGQQQQNQSRGPRRPPFRPRGTPYPPQRRYQRPQQGQGQQQNRQYNTRDQAPPPLAPPSADSENKQQNNRRRRPNNRNQNSENTPAAPKILSKTAVFVANLPFSVTDEGLTKIFEDHHVKNAHVVKTRNGRSRGYGFVDFETEQDQKDAITAKNGFQVPDERSTAEKPRDPRPITVNISHSVAPTEQQ